METLTPTTDATLAPVITALHEVYSILSESVLKTEGVELPPAIFTVQRSARAWGHISTVPTWKQEQEEIDTDYPYATWAISMGLTPTKTTEKGFHEIMVSGENLRRGARAVFGTTAHETAHALNIVKKIRDTDTNGRHNKKFKTTAEQVFGLTITKLSESIGWSNTEVSDECAERWGECIAKLEEAIAVVSGSQIGRGGSGGFGIMGFGGGTSPKGRNKNLLKAECSCGKSIRVSRVNLDYVGACRACGDDFTVWG